MKTEIKIVILSIMLFVFVCFIDAVFLYLEYPDECLEEIIKIDSTAKVVIASGFTVDENTGKIIASSAKGFIRKPFILKEALRTVLEILDSD